jgi:hypothetical protein
MRVLKCFPLFNIQDQMEYPFDKVGMDDIKLETFKFDR